jgi:hypothetical protein
MSKALSSKKEKKKERESKASRFDILCSPQLMRD